MEDLQQVDINKLLIHNLMNIIDQSALKKLDNVLPIIFQTDTLPAIGCLPKFSEIIYKQKRDKNKPLILMGAEILNLINLCINLPWKILNIWLLDIGQDL